MSSVLITGANRGIGLALTEAYCDAGEDVFATCRNPAGADELQALARDNANVTVAPLDVTDAGSISVAAATFGDGPLDILINNAGVISPGRQSSLEMDFDGWAHAFAVNTMGPLRTTLAFLANLRAARGAKVVTVSSAMGSSASASGYNLAYRSTKAAVNRVMQGLASDLKRDGIIAIALHPGWVRTAMGGRGAPVSAEESAAKIVSLVDRLTARDTGSFLDTDGKSVPW